MLLEPSYDDIFQVSRSCGMTLRSALDREYFVSKEPDAFMSPDYKSIFRIVSVTSRWPWTTELGCSTKTGSHEDIVPF